MDRSDKREIDSRLEVLLVHLLKWQVQEGFRSGSWSGSIREQRSRIEDLLGESPSLRRQVAQIKPTVYARARREAANKNRSASAHVSDKLPLHPGSDHGRGFSARRLRSYGGRCRPLGEIVKIS